MFDIFLNISQGVLEQGFIYGIMALGVYISYHILDFPDLSVDGTFPLGAAVTAILITSGVNPWLALIVSFIAGISAGLVTGILHVKLKITDLLSGILTMTALYSINLRIAGKSNLPLLNQKTIFNSGIASYFPKYLTVFTVVIITLVLALLVKFVLDWYLKTKSGFLLRAAGDNPNLVTSLAKDCGKVKIVGLAIANGFAALSGSIMCQQQRFFDVTMGTGIIVMGLASVIIGMTIFKRAKFIRTTTMVLAGSIIYKGCLAAAIAAGLHPNDMKLITSALFVVALVSNKLFTGGRKAND